MTAKASAVALLLTAWTVIPAHAVRQQPLTATRLAVGASHTCAIATDGRTICWGDNRDGQAGGGNGIELAAPGAVGGPRLVEIAAGGRHTCGLDQDGRAWCWGGNQFGQLGNGARTRRNEPMPVKGNMRFFSITAGDGHTCALTEAGEAWCWGDQWDRAAGAFRAGDNLTEPFPVKGNLQFDELAAGGHHTCGVTRDGGVWCWGRNAHGQAAPGVAWDAIDYPVQVAELPPARSVSAGETYSCALSMMGSINCWGSLVSDESSLRAFRVGEQAFDQIAGGYRHICARTAGAETWCWGDRGPDESGPVAGEAMDPAPIPDVRLESLAAGETHTCGLDASRAVLCWGDNARGQLGRPGPGTSTPMPIHDDRGSMPPPTDR